MKDEEAGPPDATMRRALLVQELTSRLRRFCADWPEDLFSAMVDRLADITLKYEGATTMSTYDRRSTDRLLDELKAALLRNEAARERDDGQS